MACKRERIWLASSCSAKSTVGAGRRPIGIIYMQQITILVGWLVLVPFLAKAQRTVDSAETVLEETVISASQVVQSRAAVAQSVKVLTKATMEAVNAQTTADLLQATGSVFVQRSQQGGGSPVLRGFEASRVLLVVDGIRMNNAIYRSGHLQNSITMDHNALERVEVLFGPASTVYGSDALGGAVCFYTKNPVLSNQAGLRITKGTAMVRMGSANRERTANLGFQVGGKRWGTYTSLTYSDFGDVRMGTRGGKAPVFGLRNYYVERFQGKDSLVANPDPYVQKRSGYQQYDVLQKVLFRPSDRVQHGLNLQFSNSGLVPRYDRLTDPGFGGQGLRYAEWNYGPQTRFLAAYHLQLASAGWWNGGIRTTLSYQHLEESRISRRFDNPNRRNQTEQVGVWGMTTLGERHREKYSLRMGADVQHNNVVSEAFEEQIDTGIRTFAGTRYPDGGSQLWSASAFTTYTVYLGRGTLHAGARVGYAELDALFKDTTYFPFPFSVVRQRQPIASGNIGGVFAVRPALTLRANLSSGFRTPNVDDLGKVFDSQPGSLIVPNPGIRPEQTYNLEAGWLWKVFPGLRWEFAAWYTLFNNAIVTDDFSFNGQDSILYDGEWSRVLANQNKRQAVLFGLTSSVEWELYKGWMLTANYTYTKGRVLEATGSSPLDHIPPIYGRVGLRYQHRKGGAEAYCLWNGSKPIEQYALNGEDNEQYAPEGGMPAWQTIHLRFHYQAGPAWRIQIGVDNLFDVAYRTFASGINGPGRNLFIALRAQLG